MSEQSLRHVFNLDLEGFFEWFAARVAWLYAWHLDPGPERLDADLIREIIERFGDEGTFPKDHTERVPVWANMHILRYSDLIIHEAHFWLLGHRVFGGPIWEPVDHIKCERSFNLQMGHLSALLDFVGVKLAQLGPPEGTKAKRKRGRRAKYSVAQPVEMRIVNAWKDGSGEFRTKKDLAKELDLPVKTIEAVIEKHQTRKRRNKTR